MVINMKKVIIICLLFLMIVLIGCNQRDSCEQGMCDLSFYDGKSLNIIQLCCEDATTEQLIEAGLIEENNYILNDDKKMYSKD